MKLSPRYLHLKKAERYLMDFLQAWDENHALTNVEYLNLLTQAVQRRLQIIQKCEREEADREEDEPC